jgi:hypothetical protein
MLSEKRIVVRKTTLEQEQADKDAFFASLSPEERLKIHEQLRERIWGGKYNSLSLEGLKVTKKPAA